MPWEYLATIWNLDPFNQEGWISRKGKLVYCDASIARVQTPEGLFEAPLHCVYIQAPLVWFIDAVRKQNISTGKYGAGLSGVHWDSREVLSSSQPKRPAAGSRYFQSTANIRNVRSQSDEEDLFGED